MIDIYEKLGNYCLDISKYILTGVVIATFFRSFDSEEYQVYLIGAVLALMFMLFSFMAFKRHNDNEYNSNKKKGKRL